MPQANSSRNNPHPIVVEFHRAAAQRSELQEDFRNDGQPAGVGKVRRCLDRREAGIRSRAQRDETTSEMPKHAGKMRYVLKRNSHNSRSPVRIMSLILGTSTSLKIGTEMSCRRQTIKSFNIVIFPGLPDRLFQRQQGVGESISIGGLSFLFNTRLFAERLHGSRRGIGKRSLGVESCLPLTAVANISCRRPTGRRVPLSCRCR
jgi:hypothetical protein